MESGLKLVTVIGPSSVNATGESLDHIVDELDGSFLVVALIDLHGSNSRRIIASRILKTIQLLPIGFLERQELNINLDMMTRNLLLVPLGLHRTTLGVALKPVQTLATQD